ncbi:MAG: RHS repeat-associated core domain-containing protein [Candidatus Kapaibacterium sp.]
MGKVGIRRPEREKLHYFDDYINYPFPTNNFSREIREKSYELKDHLGNVRSTFSDLKRIKTSPSGFALDLINTTNYYPFGMQMAMRTLNNTTEPFHNGSLYRYGFNGKESDNEIAGDGNSYDYGFRIYNPQIAKFLSVDPLSKSYPWYTPYQFAGNKPIWAIDLDGLEEFIFQYTYKNGTASLLRKIDNSELRVINFPEKDQVITKIDKRTGEPMNFSEIGKVQYKYFDEEGNPLNLRRNYKGEYVRGGNEFMELGNNNLFGSIYIGPFNPTLSINGREEPDYRREPQDEVDYAAMLHDMRYDKQGASGWDGAFFNRLVRPDDVDLVNSSNSVLNRNNGIDKVTNMPISSQTKSRAQGVSALFQWILQHTKPEVVRPSVFSPTNPGVNLNGSKW